MKLSDLSVGAKVTVHSYNWRTCRTEPSAVLTITSVSSRVMKTDDGHRWHPTRGTQLAENGKEIKGSTRLYPYKEDDDAIVRKAAMVNKCAAFLSPGYSADGPMENMGLLSEEDWSTLVEIAERYSTALTNKKTS